MLFPYSKFLGLIKWVAPNSNAAFYFLSLISIPTIIDAPRAAADYITLKPTAPNPKTATELLAWTFHVFSTAPHPVETPQPSKHIYLRLQIGDIFAALISAITVYSEKVEHPIKWNIIDLSEDNLNRDVPSVIVPFP